MARNTRVKETLSDAQKVVTVWKEEPQLVMGELKYKDFEAICTAVDGLIKDTQGREAELVGLKKKRDDQVKHLQDLVTRFRSMARAQFGPDSKEYAQVGGTPKSSRKARTQKAGSVATTQSVQNQA